MTINRRLHNTITNAFFTDIMSALLSELQTIVGRLLRGEGLSTDVECGLTLIRINNNVPEISTHLLFNWYKTVIITHGRQQELTSFGNIRVE